MRVHVISDMEGVAGIVKWEQTTGGESLYEEGRKLYTEEINAAIRRAVAVHDHDLGGTSPPLNQRFWKSRPEIVWFMTPSRVPARACMPTKRAASQPCSRNTLVGETGINAALCGTWGCPVLMVTGDEASCREGAELLGDGLTTVAVKRGFGSFGARIIPPVRARELIEEGAKRALADLSAVPPWDPGRPAEIRVEYKNTSVPDQLRFRTSVERVDDRTIVSRADNWWEAWKQFYF